MNCNCTILGIAVEGECSGSCPTKMWISLTISNLGTIITFSGFAAHAYIYQRIVSEVDRTFTQGIRSSVVRALGTLPAPLIFGWVIDKFCTVWRESDDGATGNCWVYDVDRFEKTRLVSKRGFKFTSHGSKLDSVASQQKDFKLSYSYI